ncbi:hypothetical protein OG885_06825 [Streptomyces sp. NBC_00028]|uniref:hypothetical protein n=1 Tax=Streptomyces sp. NBC_00028 TaxID=2975624 RepID=UPI003250F665
MTSAARTVDDLARIRPELVALARCVSLTISVDHGFLRRARLRFLPRTTAGLEAELWFSALVEAADTRSLLLRPEVAEHLRTDLARTAPALLRDVRDFTAAEHARAPLVVRLYEELLWSGLHPADHADPEVARHAERVLRTVSGHDTSEDVADDTGRWALHYAHRLPRHLFDRDDVWRIRVASCERLGLDPPPDSAGLRAQLTAQARGSVQRPMVVGVAARSDGIVLSRPPADDARTVLAQGTRHRVRIDALSPLSHAPDPVRLELLDGQSVQLSFTVVQRLGPEGNVRMTLSHPGVALDVAVCDFTGTSTEAAHCALLFGDGTIVLHGGDGRETGRLSVGAAGGLALSPDGSVVSYVRDGIRHHLPLRSDGAPWTDVPGPEPDRTVFRVVTDHTLEVRATSDGQITATTWNDSRETSSWRPGRAPWRVKALAVTPPGADHPRVAVVGSDTTLIEFPLRGSPGPPPDWRRDTLLRFCADRVFATADGGWVVSGRGGPVELSTEDGRAYRVLPDLEPAAEAPDLPAWSRGCVLVETDPLLETPASLPDVVCLAVTLPEGSDGPALRMFAEHPRGVRLIVGVDVSGPAEQVLDTVVRLLDHGVDGLRLHGADDADATLLADIRHLVDGYDERLLLCASDPPGPRREAFHVVPASALVSALGFAVRSRSLPAGVFEAALDQLRSQIGTTFGGRPRPYERELGLPPALSPDAQLLAAAIVLSLPGCPVLPAVPLLTSARGAALHRLLTLRDHHLALSRGDCEVLDVGTPHVLAVARRYGDDEVLCLVNVAEMTPKTAVLPPGLLGGTVALQDPVDGSVVAVPERTSLSLHLAVRSVRWLRMLPR